MASEHLPIRIAANQFVSTQLSSGLFPYDFNFSSGKITPMINITGVNLVRQTSAAFTLSGYLTHFKSVPVEESLKLFLQQSSSRSLPISKGNLQSILEWSGFYKRWQIWTLFRQPLDNLGLLYNTSGNALLVSVDNDYERAWPGSTALTLYSALQYFSVTGDTRFNEAIHRWKEGLLALKVPGRGFRHAAGHGA